MESRLPDRTGCDIARTLERRGQQTRVTSRSSRRLGVSDPMQLADARAAGFDAILVKSVRSDGPHRRRIRELLAAPVRIAGLSTALPRRSAPSCLLRQHTPTVLMADSPRFCWHEVCSCRPMTLRSFGVRESGGLCVNSRTTSNWVSNLTRRSVRTTCRNSRSSITDCQLPANPASRRGSGAPVIGARYRLSGRAGRDAPSAKPHQRGGPVGRARRLTHRTRTL
jgi:hypothetical protein